MTVEWTFWGKFHFLFYESYWHCRCKFDDIWQHATWIFFFFFFYVNRKVLEIIIMSIFIHPCVDLNQRQFLLRGGYLFSLFSLLFFKYRKNCIVKYYCKLYVKKCLNKNLIKIKLYSCDAKVNFSSHYSSLQCHMILQKSIQYADLLL